MSNPAIPVQQEVKVVALLAQGRTREEISQIMGDDGHPVSLALITKIKKRNKENFEIIKQKMLEREEADALAIKDQANRMLASRLKDDTTVDGIIEKARRQYMNEEIDIKQYTKILRLHRRVSIPELVSVSKEMHSQSGGGEEKPVAQKDLAALVAAIRSGDEVTVNQLIFNRGGESDNQNNS